MELLILAETFTLIFFKTRNRGKLESRQVRVSNHTYVRPYTLYSAENAEGREIGGRSYSRLHRFLNLFGGRNRGGGETALSEFVRLKIYPMRVVYQATSPSLLASLSPPLFPREFALSTFFPPPFPFFIFNFISLFVTLPLVPSLSFSLSLPLSSTAFIDNFSITRVGKKRNILYTKFVATRLEMVKNSATVGHCSPQLSKFVGKFLFQIEGDKEETGGSL